MKPGGWRLVRFRKPRRLTKAQQERVRLQRWQAEKHMRDAEWRAAESLRGYRA